MTLTRERPPRPRRARRRGDRGRSARRPRAGQASARTTSRTPYARTCRWRSDGSRRRPSDGRRDGLSTHRRRWYRCSSFPRLCLSFGALPRVSVQAKGKDEGDPTLTRPVKRSANSRSVPRRCREGSHPLPAVPSPLRGAKSHKTSLTDLS